jgi:ATP phosphoribosyltransferase
MSQIQIVVPDGSMQKTVYNLFARAGLPIRIESERTKQGSVPVDWIERVAFQRPQEIPLYLESNHFDVAIVGEDWIANWTMESRFKILAKLPIGRSGDKPVQIVLAVSEKSDVERPEDLPRGCEVATEYVQLTQRFFERKGRMDIKIVPSYGNTEHKIGFGATAIVDVTESGRSLRENKLKIIGELMKSHTAIVANRASYGDENKQPLITCFAKLIYGAHQSSRYVSLTANVPKEKVDAAGWTMGGLRGPSCSELLGPGKGWFALRSIVPCEDEHKIIFNLLEMGVRDIIVERDIPMIMS